MALGDINADIIQGYWTQAEFDANPTVLLGAGQIIHLEQTGTYKIGDGVTALSALSFLGGSGGGGGAVDSVNGKTGVVVLDANDVGLGNVDNTSDADKPVSTATQTALNNKQDRLSQVLTGGAITVGTYGGSGTDNDIRVTSSTYYIATLGNFAAPQTDFLDISLCSAGNQRYIGIYGNNLGEIVKLESVEASIAQPPATPADHVLFGNHILVTDTGVSGGGSLPLAQNLIAVGNASSQAQGYPGFEYDGNRMLTPAVQLSNSASLGTGIAGLIKRVGDKISMVIATGLLWKELTLNDVALVTDRIPYVTTNGRLTTVDSYRFIGQVMYYADTTAFMGLGSNIAQMGAFNTRVSYVNGTITQRIDNVDKQVITALLTRITNTLRLETVAGTGSRIAKVDATGNFSATEELIDGIITDAATIALLIKASNWTGVVYTGAPLTATYAGQIYRHPTAIGGIFYKYEMYTDTEPIRTARV